MHTIHTSAYYIHNTHTNTPRTYTTHTYHIYIMHTHTPRTGIYMHTIHTHMPHTYYIHTHIPHTPQTTYTTHGTHNTYIPCTHTHATHTSHTPHMHTDTHATCTPPHTHPTVVASRPQILIFPPWQPPNACCCPGFSGRGLLGAPRVHTKPPLHPRAALSRQPASQPATDCPALQFVCGPPSLSPSPSLPPSFSASGLQGTELFSPP